MAKIQISTGDQDKTINTNSVWDRIIGLETSVAAMPSGEKLEAIESQLAQRPTNEEVDSKILTVNTGGTIDLSYKADVAYVNDKMIEALKGETGKNLKIVAGVIRNSGSGWQQIIESNHGPINVESVTNDQYNIVINYPFTAKNVISFVACPDEAMIQDGIMVGSSVGIDSAKIYLTNPKQAEGYLYYNGTTFTTPANSEIKFESFDPATGDITLLLPKDNLESRLFSVTNSKVGYLAQSLGFSGVSRIKVAFTNYSGVKQTTPSTSMAAHILMNLPPRIVDPSTYTKVSSNIWFVGVFEV